MQRRVIPELLDDDVGTPAQIAASLRDLACINAWFGGTGTTTELLRRLIRQSGCRELSVLEVGAGAGDVALGAQRLLAREGISLQINLLDRAWSHLPAGGVAPAVAGDALRLPLRDGSVDVVSCALLAHHFEPEGLRQFAAEALRVARRALLINDLIRSRLHLALVYLGMPLFRSRMTWHDAPASVRRAYNPGEMRHLLADLGTVQISRHYLFRMGVLLWK